MNSNSKTKILRLKIKTGQATLNSTRQRKETASSARKRSKHKQNHSRVLPTNQTTFFTKTSTNPPPEADKLASYTPPPVLPPADPPASAINHIDRLPGVKNTFLLVDASIRLILGCGCGGRHGTRRRSHRRRRSNLRLLTSGRRRRRRHCDHRRRRHCDHRRRPARVRVGGRSPRGSLRPSPARHVGWVVGAVGSRHVRRRRYAGSTLFVVRDVAICGYVTVTVVAFGAVNRISAVVFRRPRFMAQRATICCQADVTNERHGTNKQPLLITSAEAAE